MRLLAVVVLYHPGEDLVGNINSYLPQVDKLLLWDNTPADAAGRISLTGVCHPERLEYRGCGGNVGIGAALNDAVAYAREHGYTHLLTLDQDSFFLDGDFGRYRMSIQDYEEDRRVIFSVNYFIKSQRSSLYPVTDTIDEVSSAMTSGTVYPVGLFAELGVFMDELFVWGIDCEYCRGAYRLFQKHSVAARPGISEKETPPVGQGSFPERIPSGAYLLQCAEWYNSSQALS